MLLAREALASEKSLQSWQQLPLLLPVSATHQSNSTATLPSALQLAPWSLRHRVPRIILTRPFVCHRRDVREILVPVNMYWLHGYARVVNVMCTLCVIAIGCACRDCCRLNVVASHADGRFLLFHIFTSGPGHKNGVTHVFGVILGVLGAYKWCFITWCSLLGV